MEYVAFGKTDEAGATAIHWCRIFAVCVLFLWLSGVIIRRERVFAVTSYLAGFSFFLFTIHIPALNALTSRVWIRLFPMRNTFFRNHAVIVPPRVLRGNTRELSLVQRVVFAAAGEQFVVAAGFYNRAVGKDDNHVRVADG